MLSWWVIAGLWRNVDWLVSEWFELTLFQFGAHLDSVKAGAGINDDGEDKFH